MADPKTFTQDELDAAVQKATAPLIAKRDELMDEVKETRRDMKSVKAQLAELEQEKKAGGKGITADDLKKMREEVRVDLEKEFAPHKEKAEALTAENRRLKLDNVVKAAMAKGGARADRIDALFRLKQDEFELTDDGQPMLKNRKGTPVEKYVSEDLKTEFPEFFAGTGSRGGGASRSSAGGGSSTTIAADDGKAFLANLEGIKKGEVVVQ